MVRRGHLLQTGSLSYAPGLPMLTARWRSPTFNTAIWPMTWQSSLTFPKNSRLIHERQAFPSLPKSLFSGLPVCSQKASTCPPLVNQTVNMTGWRTESDLKGRPVQAALLLQLMLNKLPKESSRIRGEVGGAL